ncbi:MAG: HD-GYP domain-containing protein [Sulfuricaulis sp.]
MQCAHCDIVLTDRPAALVRALDAREGETANHSQRVARYTHLLAHVDGIGAEDCLHICRGALLHDIGKIGIPDAILNKPGQLTDEEWQVMRRHPEIGARILEGIPFLAPAAEIVLAHHEHFDGGGYPRGLAGEAIPIGARLFAVADALDAITTDRPYHRAEPLDGALRYLEQEAGRRFDPRVVDTLEQHRPAMEQLMRTLAGQADISIDPAAIEQDVRHDTGITAAAATA